MRTKIYALSNGNAYLISTTNNPYNGNIVGTFTNDVNRCKLMDKEEIKEHLEVLPKLKVRIINTIGGDR